MTIIEFITARLDEAEQRLCSGPYRVRESLEIMYPGRRFITGTIHAGDCEQIGCVDDQCNCGATACTCGAIERQLRAIAAARAIVAECRLWPPADFTDQQLHEHHAHPAYEYATTQGPRKAMYDVPPDGDGWERNVDAGRDGWERFDYTEESYWRRLRPEGPRPAHIPSVLLHLAAIDESHPDFKPEWAPAPKAPGPASEQVGD